MSRTQQSLARLQLGFLLLSLFFILVLASARAQPVEPDAPQDVVVAKSADELYLEALTAYNEAHFSDAIALLERAKGRSSSARLLGKIHLYLGINLLVLGQEAAARRAFRQALIHDPTLTIEQEIVKKEIVQTFARVQQETTGELVVKANQRGALVKVDGQNKGHVPYRGQIPAGLHLVEVTDPAGQERHTEEVVVRFKERTNVQASFRLPAQHPALSPPPPAESRGRLWTWIAAGGAVVALGTGIALAVSANADYDACVELGQDPAQRSAWEDHRDAGQAKDLATNLLFGVSGTLAAAALVLYIIESPRERRPPAERAARLFPLLGSVWGLSVTPPF